MFYLLKLLNLNLHFLQLKFLKEDFDDYNYLHKKLSKFLKNDFQFI